MKNFFGAIWEAFAAKGKLATIIGLAFSLPANIHFLIAYFQDVIVTEGQMEQLLWMNLIGVIWFILPSEISITGGKFTFLIKD
jgi:TRAP-type mannitol/chloroaromatic compound transport system permease small subunit